MVKLPSILIETLRKQEVTDQFGNTAPLDSNVSESEAASLYEARFGPDGGAIIITLSESDNLTSPLLPGFTISGVELYER